MLQITRQTEYAVRGLQDLARRNSDRPVQLRTISQTCDVSEAFLAKIFQMLSQKSIVKSHRGVKGGFSLERKPEDISLRDIVEVCEGDIALNRCLRATAGCEECDSCTITSAWRDAQNALLGSLERTHLADII